MERDALRRLLDIAAVAAGSGRFCPRKRGQSRSGLPINPQPLQGADRVKKETAATSVRRLCADCSGGRSFTLPQGERRKSGRGGAEPRSGGGFDCVGRASSPRRKFVF